MFAQLVKAIRPKVVIPHHYDIWDTLFAARPDILKGLQLPPDRLNAESVLKMIQENIENTCGNVRFFIPEHHRWYRFGLGVEEMGKS